MYTLLIGVYIQMSMYITHTTPEPILTATAPISPQMPRQSPPMWHEEPRRVQQKQRRTPLFRHWVHTPRQNVHQYFPAVRVHTSCGRRSERACPSVNTGTSGRPHLGGLVVFSALGSAVRVLAVWVRRLVGVVWRLCPGVSRRFCGRRHRAVGLD